MYISQEGYFLQQTPKSRRLDSIEVFSPHMKSDRASLVCGIPATRSFGDLGPSFSFRVWTPLHRPADGEGEHRFMGGFSEPDPQVGLITSAHLPLAELSHMATLTARDAGQYSHAVCPGGKGSRVWGDRIQPVLSSPGLSDGPIFLEFRDTALSAKQQKRAFPPSEFPHDFLSVSTIPGHRGTNGLCSPADPALTAAFPGW